MKKILAFGAVLVVAGAAAVALALAGEKGSTGTAGDAKMSCCAKGKTAMAGKQCPAEAASKGQPTKVAPGSHARREGALRALRPRERRELRAGPEGRGA